MENDLYFDATRLIYLSLAHSSGNKRIAARGSGEMAALMQRFQAEPAFRQLVESGLNAMELRLLALEENGLRLTARGAEALFATTLTDYGRLLARGDLKAADVLSVHCAIAAAFFPAEPDLELPVADLGGIVMADVIEILRRFARAESALPESDDRLHPQIRTVARRLRELPEDNPDRIRAGSGSSWTDLIGRVLEHMVETGYLLALPEPEAETVYRPTSAYQSAMREGIVYSFHVFRDILNESDTPAAPSPPPVEESDVSTL